MALFTIGDLHLSLGASKPMDVFGGAWVNYTEKIDANWRAAVAPSDTVVLAGDSSWGMSLEESAPDFRFIDALPGKKLILKGNHDYFWTTCTKMKRFLDSIGVTTIDFLFNNSFVYESADGPLALCGTRGWFYEEKGDDKVYRREVGRLAASLSSAPKGMPVAAFLHYPPLTAKGGYECADITALLERHAVKHCYYGHLHGRAHRDIAFTGQKGGVCYHLIASDYVGFAPVKVCD